MYACPLTNERTRHADTMPLRCMHRGVARFERYVAEKRVDLPYDTLTLLYEDPSRLAIIQDPWLRMQCRSAIVEAQEREYAQVRAVAATLLLVITHACVCAYQSIAPNDAGVRASHRRRA